MSDRIDLTTASLGDVKAKATRAAVRGLVAKEVAQGLVLGAVLLTLAGAALALTHVVDPALAFLLPGALLLALVGGGAAWTTRARNNAKK